MEHVLISGMICGSCKSSQVKSSIILTVEHRLSPPLLASRAHIFLFQLSVVYVGI